MSYPLFLALFLDLPLIALGLHAWAEARRGRGLLAGRTARLAAGALLAHVAIAVAYTTPWDNYLVASGVWSYDPARVVGVTLGWVPLEEYLFFALQPLVAGLWLFALAARLPAARLPAARPESGAGNSRAWRFAAVAAVASVWLVSIAILAAGWRPGTYLGLELAWALPPIALQLAAGADILWRQRRSVVVALGSLTLYLSAADALAIGSGVWTIDPAQSLGVLIGGLLPIEEAVFFLLTNTLIVFGLTLALAPETWQRAERLKAWLRTLTRGRRALPGSA